MRVESSCQHAVVTTPVGSDEHGSLCPPPLEALSHTDVSLPPIPRESAPTSPFSRLAQPSLTFGLLTRRVVQDDPLHSGSCSEVIVTSAFVPELLPAGATQLPGRIRTCKTQHTFPRRTRICGWTKRPIRRGSAPAPGIFKASLRCPMSFPKKRLSREFSAQT